MAYFYTVAIVGSRTFGQCACVRPHLDMREHSKGCLYPEHRKLMRQIVERLSREHDNLRVISGRASGTDTLAEMVAQELMLPFTPFPPDPKLGVPGLFKRNSEMVEAADMVIAIFWPAKSSGTADTVRKAVAAKKPTWSFYRHEWTREA